MQTVDDMWQHVIEEWEWMDQHAIDNTVKEWRRHLCSCVAVKGGYFKDRFFMSTLPVLYAFTIVLISWCPVLYIVRLCHKDCSFRVTLHADLKTDQKTDTKTSLLVSTMITLRVFFYYYSYKLCYLIIILVIILRLCYLWSFINAVNLVNAIGSWFPFCCCVIMVLSALLAKHSLYGGR